MTWSSLPQMSTIRDNCQAGLITNPDGSQGILVAGGAHVTQVEYLDLETLVWEPRSDLPFDIDSGCSVPFQTSFLIVGGYSIDGGSGYSGYLDTIFFYDPNVDQWQILDQTLATEKDSFTAFMVPDYFANCS